jgi:uncharacterized protein YcbK (DUF882 family)
VLQEYLIGRILVLKNRIATNIGTNNLRLLFIRAVIVSLCALFAVFFTLPITTISTATAETRTLKLYFTHTRESATITFKKNGRYLPRGLKKLNRFLRDWRRNEPTRMDPRLFDLVWEVYRKSGSRKPIYVISGYRSPKTNASLRRRGRKVASKSQHMKGRALDFFLKDVSVDKLRALGLHAHAGGVGYYRGSFIHLDTGSVRHWPRMSRRQLARVFPRGRTLHVPSDGKPMKGYKYAVAQYKKRKRNGGPILVASNRSSSSSSNNGNFLKRIFGGGRDEEEDNASIRVATKRPAKKIPQKKETRLALATASALANAKKSRNRVNSLPGVNIADVPAAKERPEEPDAAAIPVLPRRGPIPKLRPGSKPTIADNGIAVAEVEANPQTTTTIVASRFDSAASTLPVLRPPLKIENSRFALAAAPELTVTQKAAATLAASAPPQAQKPELASTKKINTEIFEPTPTDKNITLAMLGTTRSAAIPQKNESLTQTALGGIDDFTTAATTPNQNLQKPAKISAEISNTPVAMPVQADRIDRAFSALSTNLSAKPRSRPGADFNPVRSTIPTKKSQRAPNNTRLKTRTASVVLAVYQLQLGNLDSRAVTTWALSHSTRIGVMAKLTAPRYIGILKNAPVAIYNNGFDNNRLVSRTNRFSGQAVKRIAFAKFLTTQLSRNQVFPTDRY